MSNFAFIDVNEVSDEQRARNRSLIRSRAMQAVRQRQRQKKQEEQRQQQQAERDPTTSTSNAGASSSSDSSTSPEGNETVPTRTTSTHDVFSDDNVIPITSAGAAALLAAEGGIGSDFAEALGLMLQPFRSPSPLELLGAGRVDPFGVYPTSSTPLVSEVVDHSVNSLWPGLLPNVKSGDLTALTRTWHSRMMNEPALYHAFIFAGAVHLDTLRRSNTLSNSPEILAQKIQAIRMVSERLSKMNPNDQPSDDVLLAIVALAHNELQNIPPSDTLYSPFSPPLKLAQWINVYGNMSIIYAHVDAIRQIVDMRGGLDKIEMSGLAETISFADILGSSMALAKPYFPLFPAKPDRDHPQNKGFNILSNASAEDGSRMKLLVTANLNHHLLGITEEVIHLNSLLGHYANGTLMNTNLRLLIDERNAVQHQLLSLPSRYELTIKDPQTARLYEIYRLGLLLYSTSVMFPIPSTSSCHAELVQRLQTEIGGFPPPISSEPPNVDFLLWVLVIGGIAATRMPARPWYERILKQLLDNMDVDEWDEIVLIMRRFLWMDIACEPGARKLIEDVKKR